MKDIGTLYFVTVNGGGLRLFVKVLCRVCLSGTISGSFRSSSSSSSSIAIERIDGRRHDETAKD
jgi:hypothetical protein